LGVFNIAFNALHLDSNNPTRLSFQSLYLIWPYVPGGEGIEAATLESRLKFLKAAHIPLYWKDAPVAPFGFNRKAKSQGKIYFVSILARFNPKFNTFGFESMIGVPSDQAPRNWSRELFCL